MRRISALIIGLTVLSNPSVRAEEGRIPIFEPITITQSGKYVVTRDITAPPEGGPVISVMTEGSQTESVEIDLNGFTLTGSTTSAVVNVSSILSFTLRNGSVNATDLATGSVSISNVANRTVVENLGISGGTIGLGLFGTPNFAIRQNTVTGSSTGIGVLLAQEVTGIIEDNLVRNVADVGIFLGAPSSNSVIQDNRVEDTAGSAIQVIESTGLSIVRNNVRGGNVGENTLTGIYIRNSDGCHVARNSVNQSSEHGIRLENTTDCSVVNNVTVANQSYGLFLQGADRNYIGRNVVNNNGPDGCPNCWGIYFDSNSDDNTYSGNTARGNRGNSGNCSSSPDPVCGAPNLCDQGTGNSSFGDNMVPGPPPC